MLTEIKAIETRYKGYRFRSRLEARWAVFFSSLNIEWVYEKEGFELPSGWYLPDFWIAKPGQSFPLAGYWVEIKPNKLDNDEFLRTCKCLSELTDATRHSSYIISGDPFDFMLFKHHHSKLGWAVTSHEDFADFQPTEIGQREFLALSLAVQLTSHVVEDIRNAMTSARSARFEHGDRG